MPTPRFSAADVCRIGRDVYDTRLRALVETEANLGRLISIDIETGDYEIGDDPLGPAERLLARRPEAAIYGGRIGYDAVYAVGGTLNRTAR